MEASFTDSVQTLVATNTFLFFFQAEDGIRDGHVTGVQTCALPIFSAHLKRTHLTSQLGESLNKEVVLAGWVHDVRVLGGISFLLLRDMSGIVQVTAPKAKAPAEVLKKIASLHQEDVLFVRGMVVASKIAKKGIEVIPSELEVVSRAETPLPLDPRGVQNTLLETRRNWPVLVC